MLFRFFIILSYTHDVVFQLAEDEYYDSFDDQSDAESDADDLCTRVVVDGRQAYQCNCCDYTRQLSSTVRRHYKHVSTAWLYNVWCGGLSMYIFTRHIPARHDLVKIWKSYMFTKPVVIILNKSIIWIFLPCGIHVLMCIAAIERPLPWSIIASYCNGRNM